MSFSLAGGSYPRQIIAGWPNASSLVPGLPAYLGEHRLAPAALPAARRGCDAEAGGALQLFERSDRPIQIFLLSA